MMKILTAGLAIALLGTTGIASADHNERQISGGSAHELFRDGGGSSHAQSRNGGGSSEEQSRSSGSSSQSQSRSSSVSATIAAPEIDPASMVAGFTLLGGALVVLTGRRATNRKY